jgi:hypothetical protein
MVSTVYHLLMKLMLKKLTFCLSASKSSAVHIIENYKQGSKYNYFYCILLNIAYQFKCYISKSKLVLSECNDLYCIAIAFTTFTLHEKANIAMYMANL